MVYKKYKIGLIIRLILILINLVLLSPIIFNPNRLFSILILIGLLIFQIYELISHQLRIFKSIEEFLSTLEHEDRSLRFIGKLPKALQSFSDLFNNLLKIIEKKKSENEAQYIFLQELMRSIKVGVFTVSDSDKIDLANPTSLQLLDLANFFRLDQIKDNYPLLFDEINNCKSELTTVIETGNQSFSVQISNLIIDNKRIKLVSLQDIRHQIELKEMEAWHQLIRTLGHEILNSVTPISSMTETSLMLLVDSDNNTKMIESIPQNQIEKIRTALGTVDRRSKGLLGFIENYRKLTRMPKPNFEKVDLIELAQAIISFLKIEFDTSNIKIVTKFYSKPIIAFIDKGMIEQVLINLIRNAIQAMENSKQKELIIEINAKNQSDPYIQITDTGIGIKKEIRDKIFIPFYSTKETGSGIGLSLSRQIMQLHNGGINVECNEATTTFTLQFSTNV